MVLRIKYLIATFSFLRCVPHVFYYLFNRDKFKEDVRVNTQHHLGISRTDILGLLYLLTFSEPYRNLFYYRIGYKSYLFRWMCKPYNCFTIGTNTVIGEGMLCFHPFATIVNAEKIGTHFTVKNNVTIGNIRKGERPTIGNNVTVNANAVVIGAISIGDNAIIGAGSVVTKNVPADSVVVGNPARIIRHNGQTVDIKL